MVALTGFRDLVLPTLLDWRRQGVDCALVTLVAVEGSSPRPVGSQMVVGYDGRYVGQISSGCAEHAIVEDARACIQTGTNKLLRYGHGSPYIDIRLPCGSTIDIYIDSTIPTETIENITSQLDSRQQAALAIDLPQAALPQVVPYERIETVLHDTVALDARVFTKNYVPQIRINVFGRSTIVGDFTALAVQCGYAVETFTPDKSTSAFAAINGVTRVHELTAPDCLDTTKINSDAWTANVLMFHDHDWEPPLLAELLNLPSFYIGAIGSRKTHVTRLATLRARGLSQTKIEKIRGPVGLNIGANTPTEISLSILAEIIATIRGSRAQL